jgi:hypothetical protein
MTDQRPLKRRPSRASSAGLVQGPARPGPGAGRNTYRRRAGWIGVGSLLVAIATAGAFGNAATDLSIG